MSMKVPAVKVEVDFRDGAGFVDLTSDFLLTPSQGYSVSSGRENEAGDPISVGSCSLSLLNPDGRYSPNMSGPHAGYVDAGAGLRVTAYPNGVAKVRHQGVIQDWDTGVVSDATGKRAITAITSTDTLGAFPSYTLRQASDEVVRNTSGVVLHLPLRESSAPVEALIGSASITANTGSGWGGGALLPLDEGTDAHPLFQSSAGGLRITVAGLSVPAPWSVFLVMLSAPTANGTILSLGADSIKWDASLGFYFSSMGIGWATGTPTSWPIVLEVRKPAGTSTPTVGWIASSIYFYAPGTPSTLSLLSKIILNPTLSGGSSWSAGHLIVVKGSSPGATLAPALLASRSAGDAVANLIAWASAASISGTTSGETTLPSIEGRDASDALGALVSGMGARLVDNRDGTLLWVPWAPGTTPIAIPAGCFTRELSWGTSNVGWMTEATVSWPDGTSYTATPVAGIPAGKKKQSGPSLEGVHASRALDMSYVDWLVNTANTDGRCSALPINMLAMTAAQQATLCDANVGSRLSATPNQAWMPASLLLIAEGLEETLTAASWTLTAKTSPDIYSKLFIWNDPVQGRWDMGYLWGP